MADQKNTVRIFVAASSGPIRRSLLRIIDDLPIVELVGVTSNKLESPQCLAELRPDLLLLNPAPEKDARKNLFEYLSQHLPSCRTFILSKPSGMENSMGEFGKCAGATQEKEPASTIIDPEDQTHIRAEIQKFILEKNQPKWVAGASLPARPDGSAGYLYDYIESLSRCHQERASSGVIRDIAERRRQQAGRRHTEVSRAYTVGRLEAFVEQLPGVLYVAPLYQPGSTIYVSPRIEDLLGFTPSQWCMDAKLRIRQLHPEDRDRVLQAIEHAACSSTSYALDYRIYRRDGSMRWLHDEAHILVDDSGKPLFLQGAMIDITERKQAQEELERSHGELQEIIGALDSLRIEEQRRLAHEMHDDFGQMLAALKIDLNILQRHLPKQNAEAVKYLRSMNELVDSMVSSVRRIIANLPPKLVEDLGLFDALQSMTRTFEQRHRIACSLHFRGAEPELDTKFATALFRMAQEALNNVAKHAQATAVQVQVEHGEDRIALAIIDNGKGMSGHDQPKRGSFGLIGMRERAAALGGNLTIDSKEGIGTAIRITIPLRPHMRKIQEQKC